MAKIAMTNVLLVVETRLSANHNVRSYGYSRTEHDDCVHYKYSRLLEERVCDDTDEPTGRIIHYSCSER